MTIEQACRRLNERWRRKPWLFFAGVDQDQPRIIAWATEDPPPADAERLAAGWDGHPVVVIRVAEPLRRSGAENPDAAGR